MTILSIIGSVLWVISLVFGRVVIRGTQTQNQLTRLITIAIALPFVGVICTFIGLIGLVLLAPVLELFGWSWFITTTF